MEKMDHIAIFLNTANNITQLCLFATRSNRLIVIAIAWGIAIFGIVRILLRIKSVYHKAVCGAVVLLALPEMLQHMTVLQWNFFLATWGQTFVGMIAYATQRPNPWPEYFGYHEVMHLLTSLAGITAIFLQYHLLHDFDPDYCIVQGFTSSGWKSLLADWKILSP